MIKLWSWHTYCVYIIQVDILQTQKCMRYCTRTHTHTRVHAHTGGVGWGWGEWLINYMQIWRDEFLRLTWKILILSDKHHTVTGSNVLGPWKKKLIVQSFLFSWQFSCQKWSKVVWMDGTQSRAQKDRVSNFQRKNCSTELRLDTGFLRLLVASKVSKTKGGV